MACILMWISLNALYSRWDAERNMPAVDQGTRQRFLGRICDLAPQLIGHTLQKQRPLIKNILENAYLSPVFWRDPANPKAKGWAAEDANYLDRNLRQHDYCRVLNQVMDRLFVMRGQLVHGGATGGGKLNRRSLQHCLALLRAVLPVLLHIVMEKMCDDDWPELCYPPVD